MYFIKKTCMVCGHRTQIPKPPPVPTKDPAECQHKRVDHRGSTRSTHKTFCLDCCSFVDEIPQWMHQRSKEVGEAASSSPSKMQDLTRRTLEEHDLTQMEAGEVVKNSLGSLVST